MIDRMGLKRILFGDAGLGVWEGRNEVLPIAIMGTGMVLCLIFECLFCFYWECLSH
jgi:hypothetical protein